jgi:hypothetical protein
LLVIGHHDAPDVVTLLADEDVGAATPDDPAPVDEVADLPEPDDEAPDDEVADWDVVADVLGGVAAWDEPDEARTAVPAVSATATPAMPAVICLTRRRARCRRVAASLVLRTASGLRFTVMRQACTSIFGAPWAAGVWPL